MNDRSMNAAELLKGYAVLLELYEKIEAVSFEVMRDLQDGSHVAQLSEHFKENMAVAERIKEESRTIASLKKNLVNNSLLTDEHRTRIRQAELTLSEAVNRVVEQDEKNREFMMKQGIKISRK